MQIFSWIPTKLHTLIDTKLQMRFKSKTIFKNTLTSHNVKESGVLPWPIPNPSIKFGGNLSLTDKQMERNISYDKIHNITWDRADFVVRFNVFILYFSDLIHLLHLNTQSPWSLSRDTASLCTHDPTRSLATSSTSTGVRAPTGQHSSTPSKDVRHSSSSLHTLSVFNCVKSKSMPSKTVMFIIRNKREPPPPRDKLSLFFFTWMTAIKSEGIAKVDKAPFTGDNKCLYKIIVTIQQLLLRYFLPQSKAPN